MNKTEDSALTAELVNLCIAYLEKLFTKQITLLEFQKEVAYIATQDKYGFNELRARPFPIPIPEALQEYYRLTEPERSRIPDRFWKNPEIDIYIKERHKILVLNRGNYGWLCELKETLSFDPIMVQKIQSRLYDFEESNYI